MIKKIIYTLFFAAGLIHLSYAQDASLEAKVFYAKAEENYNNANYQEALKNLSSVEDLLGATNSKVLYLKANTYNALLANDWTYNTKLSMTLKQFFEITDQSKYPQDKYMDMVTLNLDLKSKTQEYESDFLNVKNSSNEAQITSYIKKFPKSAHSLELAPKANQLEAREKEVERRNALSAIADKHRPIIKKRLTKGVVSLSLGNAVFIPLGAGLVYYAYNLPPGNSDAAIASYVVGGSCFLTSYILDLIGVKNMIYYGKEVKKMKAEQSAISFTPCIIPSSQPVAGISLQLKF
jgi:hypothetical protein